MTASPVRETEAISAMAETPRSSASIFSVTNASTRSGAAPGQGASTVAKILVIVGSSCRPMVSRPERPMATISRIASTKARGLRKNQVSMGLTPRWRRRAPAEPG